MYKKYIKNNKKLQNYANKIIPGLSGLLGKRPEMYLPGGKWPTYYSKAKGINIWDLNGKKYLDFTMVGVGSCTLGYSDSDIDRVARKIVSQGPLTTLNPPEELILAEMLIKIHHWADQAKFARTGGEMVAMAVRLARAYTKKDKIMICGYHGWHDWYLATNIKDKTNLNNHLLGGLEPNGVPKGLAETVIPFNFNSCEDLKLIKHKTKECAAIIMEPARSTKGCTTFLKEIRKITKKNNCVLIFDEITSAWRINTGGIHMTQGIYPDLATFGKTMANGVPIAALIGKKKIMEEAKNSFISSTNWTERLGPACAVEFLKKHKKLNLGKILTSKGKKIRKIWINSAKKAGIHHIEPQPLGSRCFLKSNVSQSKDIAYPRIEISGIDSLSSFKIVTRNNNDWPVIITYFIQEMLKYGILASDRCYSNYCQTDKLLRLYEKACSKVFKKIANHLKNKNLKRQLEGPIKQMGFKRLN